MIDFAKGRDINNEAEAFFFAEEIEVAVALVTTSLGVEIATSGSLSLSFVARVSSPVVEVESEALSSQFQCLSTGPACSAAVIIILIVIRICLEIYTSYA